VCLSNTPAFTADCPGPTCSGLVWGPLGGVCYAYANAPKGFCTGSGACRTDTADCGALAIRGSALVSCGDSRCFVSSNCVTGSSASSVSSAGLCLSDWSSGSCPGGQGCGPGSTCQTRKSNGNVCSFPNECASGYCVGGYCCASPACPTCQSCSSGTCAAIPDGFNGGCSTVDCSSFVGGFVGTTCSRFNGVLGGYCLGGNCDTGASRCSTQVVAGRPSCGSSGCLKACSIGAALAAFDETAEICYQSGQQSCSASQTCDSSGTCVTSLLGLGSICSSGTQCASGICSNSGHCCSTACSSPCQTCSTGTCSNRANGANAACPSVDCSLVVYGWTGTQCVSYSGTLGGACLSGACDASPTRCNAQPLSTAGRPYCGSIGCFRSCPQYADTSSYSTVAQVCFQSGQNGCSSGFFCETTGTCVSSLLSNGQPCIDSTQCQSGICSLSGHCCSSSCSSQCTTCSSGTCLTAPDGPFAPCPSTNCDVFVSGWSGNTCAKFTGTVGGACQGGACVAPSYLRCSSSTTTSRPSCGSASCQSSCPAGGATGAFSTVSSVCLTSGQSCGTNLACDSTGTCLTTLLANAQPCTLGTQCQSGFCSSSGHCCSSACSGTCETCSTGTCAARLDGPYGSCTAPPCSALVKGWAATGECALFGSGGVGQCLGGVCDSGTSQCAGENTAARPSCGSTSCQKACPLGGTESRYQTVADVCYQNGQQSCPTGFQCDISGSCISGLLPLGNPCISGSQCSSGICSTSGHCCASACPGRCQDCSSGNCTTLADGPSATCPSVNCTRIVAGWNGTVCGAFGTDLPGSCFSGDCNTNVSRCTVESSYADTLTYATSCREVECVSLSSCQVGSRAPVPRNCASRSTCHLGTIPNMLF
jgi:hypothetical protein